MLSFKEFLRLDESTALNEANEHNGWMTNRYELGAALHLHDKVKAAGGGSNDPEHAKRVKAMRDQHAEIGKKLDSTPEGKKVKEDADSRAKKSAEGYADSLEKNHGVRLSDVAEVHHTGTHGLGDISGNAEHDDKTANPHDIAVKTKSNKVLGSSLKATSGTMSNNGSKKHPAMAASYKGLEDKVAKAKTPEAQSKAVKDAHKSAGKAYAADFNSKHPDEQHKEMSSLIRQNTSKNAVALDYTKGDGKSTPYHKMKIVQAVNSAHRFSATHSYNPKDGTTYTHIRAHKDANDKEGVHIGTLEHRSTHSIKPGKAVSAQHNFKAAPGMTNEA